jgi:hypothetical protein
LNNQKLNKVNCEGNEGADGACACATLLTCGVPANNTA